jgi:hypothetical protein
MPIRVTSSHLDTRCVYVGCLHEGARQTGQSHRRGGGWYGRVGRRLHEGSSFSPKPGPRQGVLDAVDLALLPGCGPGVYRWRLDPATSAAARPLEAA